MYKKLGTKSEHLKKKGTGLQTFYLFCKDLQRCETKTYFQYS